MHILTLFIVIFCTTYPCPSKNIQTTFAKEASTMLTMNILTCIISPISSFFLSFSLWKALVWLMVSGGELAKFCDWFTQFPFDRTSLLYNNARILCYISQCPIISMVFWSMTMHASWTLENLHYCLFWLFIRNIVMITPYSTIYTFLWQRCN